MKCLAQRCSQHSVSRLTQAYVPIRTDNRWPAPRRMSTSRMVAQAQKETKEKSPATSTKPDEGQPQPSADESGGDGIWTQGAKWAAEQVASPIFYLIAGLLAIKLVSSTGEQAGSILLFAALPITALTALSKSSLGKEVQAQLEKKLPRLQAEADALQSEYGPAKERSKWYGPQRPRFPGFLGNAPHLTGEQAGDYGFDPLGLSKTPEAWDRNLEAELVHARWAMLAAVGALVPEVLSMQGVELGEPVWWKVGKAKLEDNFTLNWGGIEGFRIAGGQGLPIIVLCQLVLMGGPEYARKVGIRSLEPVGVFLPGDKYYPGGTPFDPLGFSQKPDEFVDECVKEIKHGRLAMVACLGYAVQAWVTREGPVQNLVDFIRDPVQNNILTRLGGILSASAQYMV